ncbi:hypothetical protein [Paractinoplanes brasiliensis]|uniref:Uncharacterized protein n=1 Tax=Paractinoplanes brasiliensis TaxID=52695 RepID=A0A4R6JVC7_9ACTN|nr:hypothetical protein [Actinoplanes brasiliensis]TDO40683.1 hypothetical protein C8E87_4402 [Actinoplanes brasiliensis]GID25754.1 hypothetical protein Abr02nite_07370 [Actinoplanes brasiliensis]
MPETASQALARPASAPEPLDTAQRARWELAAMAGRLRMLEARLVEERHRGDELRRERDRERRRAERLRRSESYRIGSGLLALLKNPVVAAPRLTRSVLRRLRRPGRTIPLPLEPAGVPAVAAPRPPVHLYVVIGLEFEAVREFVLTLRQRLQVDPDHRPVVMTDCESFALLRDLGVLLEYLPDRATWERHRPDRSWEDVLSERLSRLYRDHESVRTIIIDRTHPPSLAELLR